MKGKIFLISLLLLLVSCEKNPVVPDKPEAIEFRYNVRVEYTRNPDKVRCPQAMGSVYWVLWLYNPFTKDYDEQSKEMEKIDENRFQGVIEGGVFIQRSFDPPHYGYVYDSKLYDGVNRDSVQTGEFNVEGEYSVEVKPNGSNGSRRYFRIRK